MKKVLSVVLVIITLFSMFAFNTSAADKPNVPDVAIEYYETLKREGVIKSDQVIIAFDLLNSGAKFKYPVSVYNDTTGTFSNSTSVTGIYYMIPNNKELNSSSFMTPGSSIILPEVTPPTGKDFKGWKYTDINNVDHILAAGSSFVIPDGSDAFGILRFTAIYVTGEIEGDILDTLISVFIKVVGEVVKLLGFDFDIAGLLGGLL